MNNNTILPRDWGNARGRAAWSTTRSLGITCPRCGKCGTCTVSPDGQRFKCWRNGGEHFDTAGQPLPRKGTA